MNNNSPYSVTHKAVTDERKLVYLQVLAETGSHPAAACAASPHLADSTGQRPGYSSFADMRRTDPDFAAACEEAERRALGKVEKTIVDRAFTLDERPIFAKDGTKLGVQTDSRPANQMLLRLAERLAPADWSPRKQQSITAEHQHTHEHRHGVVVFQLEPHHLKLLPDERRDRFLEDLQTIRAAIAQQEADHARLPAAQAAEPQPRPGPVDRPLRGEPAPAGDGEHPPGDAGR